jgi:hypothetical protein
MAAVRGFYQTGMAMKPSKTFFLLDFLLCLKIFRSSVSNSRLLVYLSVRGQRRQAIILEIVTKYFPNICRLLKRQLSTFGLAGTRLRDETI